MVGDLDVRDAQAMAHEAGLDLVEVSPNERPPVCRLMDYGKWKYNQKQKDKKNRAKKHHESQLKEVRLRPKTGIHDQEVKVKHAREFLERGDRVQFTMRFMGREMAHKEIGMNILKNIETWLEDVSKVERPPRMLGRRMIMVLAPQKTAK